MKIKDMNEKQKAFMAARCKHNMIREFCGVCNKYEWFEDVNFPMFEKQDDGTKKLKSFGKTQVKRIGYKSWR